MRNRTLKLGLVAASALSAALPLLAAAQPAYADYGPAKGDIVGVGSDTLQYLVNFLADGDAYADPGYNQLGNRNKVVSIDAIPDANARLAFGPDGQNGGTGGTCAPGTGGTAGTGNDATPYTGGAPCVLNPTVYFRAGTQAHLRPNGSGSGGGALENDVAAGNNLPSGAHQEILNFSRASAALHPGAQYGLDSIIVATDTLPIVAATTTHAVPLDSTELANIYSQSNTGTNAYGGTGCVTWNELPGNSTGSTDTIIPIIPQPGSGTRGYFLSQISNITPGNCTVVSEENDPTAIAAQANPADAIAPISNGRLHLFLTAPTSGSAGYFLDPSCPYDKVVTNCNSGSITLQQTTITAGSNGVNINTFAGSGTLNVTSTTGFAATGSIQVETSNGNAVLNYTGTSGGNSFTGVSVASVSQGGAQSGTLATGGNVLQSASTFVPRSVDPPVQVLSGTTGDNVPAFDPSRPLYIYFRDSDITSTAPFQPGSTVNWLNSLFYNPCNGQANCVSGPAGANEYGPAGPPYIDQAEGQTLLGDAGVTWVDTGAASSFTKGGA